ncbi:hypothetical protein MASR2M15_23070 [Anaerolineales bacterium]
MRTPSGRECKFYYEDFNRGRNKQECRLVKGNPDSKAWRVSDCAACPIPNILSANASPDMGLKLSIKSGFMGLGRKYEVQAICLKHGEVIEDPYVGCTQEHQQGLDLFRQALDNNDNKSDPT